MKKHWPWLFLIALPVLAWIYTPKIFIHRLETCEIHSTQIVAEPLRDVVTYSTWWLTNDRLRTTGLYSGTVSFYDKGQNTINPTQVIERSIVIQHEMQWRGVMAHTVDARSMTGESLPESMLRQYLDPQLFRGHRAMVAFFRNTAGPMLSGSGSTPGSVCLPIHTGMPAHHVNGSAR